MQIFHLLMLDIKFENAVMLCEYNHGGPLACEIFEEKLGRHLVKNGVVLHHDSFVQNKTVKISPLFGNDLLENKKLVMLLLVFHEVFAANHREPLFIFAETHSHDLIGLPTHRIED
jgi:hypothetical protein